MQMKTILSLFAVLAAAMTASASSFSSMEAARDAARTMPKPAVVHLASEQLLPVDKIHVPVAAVHRMLPGRADDLPPTVDQFLG